MRSIVEVIQKMQEKLLSFEGYQRALVEKYWHEIVGEAARKHSRPQRIRDNVLYVSVDSSVWNQALFMEKRTVINKINQHFPRSIVQDVKFQIGDDFAFAKQIEKMRPGEPIIDPVTRKNEMDLLILRALQQKEEARQKNK